MNRDNLLFRLQLLTEHAVFCREFFLCQVMLFLIQILLSACILICFPEQKFHSSQNTIPFPDIFFFRSFKEAGITMAVDTKVMNHVRNNRKKPLVNRPDVTVTVSVPQSLINTDDVLFPYGNPFP